MPNYTKIEDLMDIEEFFDDRGKGSGSHSMNGMPPQKFNNLHQQVLDENNERHTKIKPLEGKLRNNVNMTRAMNGGSMSMNSGNLYPSNPMVHFAPEMTNPSYNEFNEMDASNYKLGPKAYSAKRPGNNSYSELVEGYNDRYNDGHNYGHRGLNCIDVANHIKSCPICSKFYENDKSIYIIVIIILVIICIILARKVLENYEK
jgi:hypothetical protein